MVVKIMKLNDISDLSRSEMRYICTEDKVRDILNSMDVEAFNVFNGNKAMTLYYYDREILYTEEA